MPDGKSSISELALHLGALTEAATFLAAELSADEWRQPYAPGKWTRLEVMGHLIDSACHNHQRIARALHQQSMTAPGYDGDAQVRTQRYASAPVSSVVETWSSHNRLLSFVLAQIPPDKEETECAIASFPPMSLRGLAFDYVAHLEHHLKQIFSGRGVLPYSGLPWPPEGRWQ